VSDTTLLAITITIMSDSKELSELINVCYRLLDSSDDSNADKFCHSAADVSAFEDALQQCSTEHFRAEAGAPILSTAPVQETVQEMMKRLLSRLLTNILPRNLGRSIHCQCSHCIEHFRAEADALSPSRNSYQKAVQEAMKSTLWTLLTSVLTRNRRADTHGPHHLSWSVDGYRMVARLAKSILSSWCIDQNWIYDVDSDGNTVFMLAAERGHTSVVELLLADPRVDKIFIDHANSVGSYTALLLAAQHGHTSIVELLLADPRVDKACIDRANEYGETAMSYAAINGHTSVVELLLADPRVDKASLDHDIVSKHRETALMRAARYGHTSIVELLLAHPCVDKAFIDRSKNNDTYEDSALMLAASNGHTAIVELLLADPRVDKACISHTTFYGDTVLSRAAVSKHWSVVRLLIRISRTSWHSIVQLTDDWCVMLQDEIPPLIVAELTRRQMCAIYPPASRLLWPVPVQSDAESAGSSGLADDDARDRAAADGIAVPECALITSFFKSNLLDVNVLRIIREYATYTL
jgi:Ankyrin repeats (3 copies)